jgi:hypothetical protein
VGYPATHPFVPALSREGKPDVRGEFSQGAEQLQKQNRHLRSIELCQKKIQLGIHLKIQLHVSNVHVVIISHYLKEVIILFAQFAFGKMMDKILTDSMTNQVLIME